LVATRLQKRTGACSAKFRKFFVQPADALLLQ
jgi:hypothetical protein